MHGRAYDDYHVGIEEAIKSDRKTFFGYVDLKKIFLLMFYNEHMLMMYMGAF
jgi:hypothetical protein